MTENKITEIDPKPWRLSGACILLPKKRRWADRYYKRSGILFYMLDERGREYGITRGYIEKHKSTSSQMTQKMLQVIECFIKDNGK